MSERSAHARAPKDPSERIVALDAVRGFAAFGIFMVNVQTFGGPYPLFEGEPFVDPLSQAVFALVDLFFVSKFFPLFSMLFGLGLSMQIRAAENRDDDVGAFVRRRLFSLLLIGLVHVTFFSTIDILVQYAVMGFALLPLRRVRDRTLLWIAAVCLLVPIVLTVIATATGMLDGAYGDATASDMIAAYAHGDASAFFAMRIEEIRGYYLWVAVYAGWEMFAMIVVGAYVERRGVLADPERHRPALVAVARRALAVGLPAATVHAALFMHARGLENTPAWSHVARAFASAVGEPSLAVAYAAAVGAVALDPRWARRLVSLADVGRAALSSYVFQSVVMSVVFFSFGLGRYGRDPPALLAAFVVVTFAVELMIARAYMRRFRFGPLESLWRRMTYSAR